MEVEVVKMEVCFFFEMEVVVKMEVCLTYPMNQYGFIDRYDAQNGFQTLVSFPFTFVQYNCLLQRCPTTMIQRRFFFL